MKISSFPLAEKVVQSGPNDRIFDSFLLLGPPFIIFIIILGRNILTTTMVSVYLLLFTSYIIYKGTR